MLTVQGIEALLPDWSDQDLARQIYTAILTGGTPAEIQALLELNGLVQPSESSLCNSIFSLIAVPSSPPPLPIPGPRGEQGPKGDQGIEGERGERGPSGRPGDKGDRGDPGQKGDPGPKGDQASTSKLQGVLLFILLCALGAGGYLLWNIYGQVETLQTEVADLRSFFYMTQVQRKNDKGQPLWKCQKDRNGKVVQYADGRCLPSDEPMTDEVPPGINGIIGKAIEERVLSAVDFVVQTRLGDFLAVLERGKTDPASIPAGGPATLDECLAVAEGGSLPQAAACCMRTPILTQTPCRIAIRCKLDPMTPADICHPK